MATYRKANDAERAEYRARVPRPVYPLAGFIKVDGVVCAVEDLSAWSKDDPQYEIVAPEGFHFSECDDDHTCDNNVHTLLCMNQRDVKERSAYYGLVSCEPKESEA